MKSLSKSQRDEADMDLREVNNSIGAIVGEAYDLVIIQLGLLGYKNVAAAGVLKEALMMRITQGKPTWLFETADRNITWLYSKDPEVEAYVDDNFEALDLTSEITEQESETGGITVETHGDEEVSPPTRQLQLAVLDDDEVPAVAEDEDSPFAGIPGMGEPKKKPWKKGRR